MQQEGSQAVPADAVLQVVTHADYQEDHLVSNVKITLGLLA